MYTMMTFETTPKELKDNVLELLNHLCINEYIDNNLYNYLNSLLKITNFIFTTLMIFRELLAILGTKIIISFDDYLILKKFSISSLVKFNLDGLNFDGNDKRYIDCSVK